MWRSFGHHKKLQAVMERHYTKEVSDSLMTTSIPAVVKSRWGTFEGPERKLLRGLLGQQAALEDGAEWEVGSLRRALSRFVVRGKASQKQGQQEVTTEEVGNAASFQQVVVREDESMATDDEDALESGKDGPLISNNLFSIQSLAYLFRHCWQLFFDCLPCDTADMSSAV